MKAQRTISGRVLILLIDGLYWLSLTRKVVLKTYIERNQVIRNLRLIEWGWVWCEELCRLRRMFGPQWITWSFKRRSLSSSIWRIPGGTPENSWWGCVARFSKSWYYLEPKNVIFHTRFQTRLLKLYSFSDLGPVSRKSRYLYGPEIKYSNRNIKNKSAGPG